VWLVERLGTHGAALAGVVEQGFPLDAVLAVDARAVHAAGSIAMSLRYAHLAPDQRREAVAMLNQKPILALTVRLRCAYHRMPRLSAPW
jgi:hypothetical protein